MFLKRQDPHTLAVSMTGVKMGDQIVQVGCAHGGRLAAVAGKVGLSGRAVVVAPDESSAARARKGAADAGVLVEIEVAPPARLPLESDGFDLAVVDDTAGLLGTMRAEDRVAAIRELLRVLRPGGRVTIVGAASSFGRSSEVIDSSALFIPWNAATVMSPGSKPMRFPLRFASPRRRANHFSMPPTA